VPEVVIDLIDRPTEVPWGAGEPTTSVVPSSIANAVYDATARVCDPYRSGLRQCWRR
jgi:CO/xanthine dehydrogenase Mo-binding subunit